MKAIFQSIWEMKDDGFIGWVLLILISACLVLVGWLLLILIDYAWRPREEGVGIITSNNYHPAYTSTTFMQSGKVLIPITTYHPKSWSITIEVEGLTDNFGVNKVIYNQNRVGEKVSVVFSRGRIWKTIYIKQVTFL